ncbi:nacht ankyrin domain-containing protein [Fusarium circinatum]|uniref:Nacht ankyrin domain-containing protein n=1 Tax=Fusarium circinatum TaxID=48490 RepID=A0A8H5WWX3_FUSCI|nr:nacht ankyrin domain-containing protein [Fusarium circinatum]
METIVRGKRKLSETNDSESPPGHEVVVQKQKTILQYDDSPRSLSAHSYTVGWIRALPIELAAAQAMLDHVHDSLGISADDSNAYTLGDMAGHNVVMACLPVHHYGTVNAATVANNMQRSFPLINLRLMKLLTAVSKLQAEYALRPSNIPGILDRMVEKNPMMAKFAYQDILCDWLFDSTYDHVSSKETCDSCSESREILRPQRPTTGPNVHCGAICSGNQVMRHGETRDNIASEMGAICFEMEAVGLMDYFPSLVIRGICDCADSYKNKQWQEYVSAAAAAYARELLSIIPAGRAKRTMEGNTARRKSLLRSLSFEYINSRRYTVKSQHSNTCSWLLTHADYLDWANPGKASDHHGFLWIKGKPGAGKSTMMNFAYKEALKNKSDTVLSFFFNARGDDLERSVVGMHRTLLFQLLDAIPALLEVFDDSTHEDKLEVLLEDLKEQKRDIHWDIEVLQSLLQDAVRKLGQGRLVCFIDALDECAEDEVEDMVGYFEDLGAFAVETKTRLRVCFSSRHYPLIDIKYGLKLVLELQRGHKDDISLYIQQRLNIGKSERAAGIRSQIQVKSGGVFMWVVLVVGMLNTEYKNGRIFAVKRRLDVIPTKLNDLFKEIISRDRRNLQDMRLCIQWILFARRPLKLEEYYFAVVSGLNLDELDEWDEQEISRDDMYRFLLSSSKGLAEITKDTTPTDGLQELWPDLQESFECTSHDQLKGCCYAWIQLDLWAKAPYGPQHSNSAKSFTHIPRAKFPFLDYATQSSLWHANATASKISQQSFLTTFNLRAWIHLSNRLETSPARQLTPNASLIYILAENNYANLIETTLRFDPRIHIEGERFGYPLFAAAVKGHEEAASALLRGASPDISNSISTELLYGRDFRSFNGQTPLQWALQFNRVGLAKHLIRSEEVKRNLSGDSGEEVLFWAAENGHTEVLRMMMSIRGINVNCLNTHRETPLHIAARSGRQDVVKLLLQTEGVDCDTENDRQLTPLLTAVERRYGEVVKLLLKAGKCDPNRKDANGQTLLSRAASDGSCSMVKLLLGAQDINVNLRDNDGRTPLICAAMLSRFDVMKLLLGVEGVEVNSIDCCGKKAQDYAIIFR